MARPPEMISCEEDLALIYEFLDGELDETEHHRVGAHFEACQRCYPHLHLEQTFREAVQRAARGETAPPELKARLRELIAQEATHG